MNLAVSFASYRCWLFVSIGRLRDLDFIVGFDCQRDGRFDDAHPLTLDLLEYFFEGTGYGCGRIARFTATRFKSLWPAKFREVGFNERDFHIPSGGRYAVTCLRSPVAVQRQS